MRGQLRHLLNVAEEGAATISVVPDSMGVHPGMGGSFTVLEFEDDADPGILLVRYVTDSIRTERSAEVAAGKSIFNDLRSIALPPVESMEFIKSLGVERYSM
jgi:hypothetical protein